VVGNGNIWKLSRNHPIFLSIGLVITGVLLPGYCIDDPLFKTLLRGQKSYRHSDLTGQMGI